MPRSFTSPAPLPGELHGEQDGPPVVLRSGIIVELRRVGDKHVSTQELLSIVGGINRLPLADQHLIAQAGIPIRLLPTAGLEAASSGKMMLGATTILESSTPGRWSPTVVRVATQTDRTGAEATSEVIQHELGHVVSVLRYGDQSELAAERYAGRY